MRIACLLWYQVFVLWLHRRQTGRIPFAFATNNPNHFDLSPASLPKKSPLIISSYSYSSRTTSPIEVNHERDQLQHACHRSRKLGNLATNGQLRGRGWFRFVPTVSGGLSCGKETSRYGTRRPSTSEPFQSLQTSPRSQSTLWPC